MSLQLPPPLTQAPSPRSFWQDFRLLTATQFRLTWNKFRQWPAKIWLAILLPSIGFISLLIWLSFMAFGALESMAPDIARGFLSLIFMIGVAGQMFFGITAAFATLYMSEDLELLFTAPVSTRAVFAAKSLVVAGTNLFTAALFIFLPGLFFGLLFGASLLYYFFLLVVSLGLLALGTALAELLNMVVMRIVPPHRSKEAVGVIGGLAGIMIAIVFQIPNMVMSSGGTIDINQWLSGQDQLLKVLDYFPWGWSSLALTNAVAGKLLPSLGWTMLTLSLGAAVFAVAFLLVERGFRRGWISLSQGEGGKRRKTTVSRSARPAGPVTFPALTSQVSLATTSPWQGMWAVAKKDLLYMKRDTREWFGYLTPLLIMVFFIARVLFFPGPGAHQTLITVLVMYTIMFSGNMALQAFGREGESDWLLNSVPLAGWPVVWGKLIATVLPTLILMEALLTGTGVAIGLAPNIILAMAVGAVLISVGSSAIGLFYSINNCRFNPDAPQQRISGGAALLMYLVNLLFVGLLALCLVYAFPPDGLVALIKELPPVSFAWGMPETLVYLFYLITVPLRWVPALRISFGLLISLAFWAAVFLGFMRATVRQSLKGFRVELVTTKGKKK